jgi:hypothetical protein
MQTIVIIYLCHCVVEVMLLQLGTQAVTLVWFPELAVNFQQVKIYWPKYTPPPHQLHVLLMHWQSYSLCWILLCTIFFSSERNMSNSQRARNFEKAKFCHITKFFFFFQRITSGSGFWRKYEGKCFFFCFCLRRKNGSNCFWWLEWAR